MTKSAEAALPASPIDRAVSSAEHGMAGATAVVAGASGFVGRSLVAHLRARGCRVIAVGRAGSRLPPADRALAFERPEPAAVAAALAGETGAVVFNCAAYGVSPADRDPALMFAANIADAGAWVEAAAAFGAGAFVHVGSCSEYGTVAARQPIGEESPLHATDLYGASKAAGGQWATALARRHAIPFLWLRVFGIVGPGEAAHRLLPSLHARLRGGARADLSPGEQMRDLLYIDDAAAGIAAAGALVRGGRGGIFNLCTGRAVSIRAVAEIAAQALGVPADRLDFGARLYRPDDQMWVVGDPARLRAASDFRPRTSLEEAIARTMRALDAARGAGGAAGSTDTDAP